MVRFWLIAGMFVVLGLWVFYRGGSGSEAPIAGWRPWLGNVADVT